jgi:glycosyltransferase involved in cell wall biosynthesis
MGGGEKYLGVAAEAVRDAFPRHRVEIVSPVPVDVERYERMLGLDLHGIGFRSGSVGGGGLGRRIRRLRLLRRYADLYLSARVVGWTADYDLLLSMVYVLPAFSRARRSVVLCQFPYQLDSSEGGGGPRRLLYRAYMAPYNILKARLLGGDVEAFQLILSQSEYVRTWVRRYWGRDSLIVNPPIDVPEPEPDLDAKQPIILSVGRFFAGGHCKRQDVMVETFRKMCDGGLTGWELHLVGSLHRSNPAHMRYFEEIKALARGYPVQIHPDAPLELVQDLYRRASLYWHAAGYGVDAERRPADLEHFGMVTAEAMGYGCVPVAIARGGQVEVVRDGVDGFLWDQPGQLAEKSMRLMGDRDMRRHLALAAREASHRFSRQRFKRRMADAVQPLVAGLEAGSDLPAGLEEGIRE